MRKLSVFIVSFCLLPCAAAAAAAGAAAGDPYRLLGVLPGHSPEDIDRAFQRIKFRIHPQRRQGNLEAKERFQELERAYSELKDPDFRTRYNIHLQTGGQSPREETNLYKILGVLSDSSREELTRAYKEVRGRIHPDRHGNSPLANERLQELQKAHLSLVDPLIRARHDRILKGAGAALTEQPQGRPNKQEQPAGHPDEPADFADPPLSPAGPEADMDMARLWHEQVFDLARELEKAGGEEDLKEAIEWHRMLAQNSHLEAMRRLPKLLEKFNMKEALYRYRIAAAAKGIGDDFRRTAAFRQAQIYHQGFSKDGLEIIPKDLEKAEELYSEAFQLGVRREAIAAQHERLEDYEKAERWLSDPESFSGYASVQQAPPAGGAASIAAMERPIFQRGAAGLAKVSLPLHEGIAAAADSQTSSALKITRALLKSGADPNAANERGETPLFLAAENLYPGAARALLRAGADPGIPNQDGVFPLHAAIASYAKKRQIKSSEDQDRKNQRVYDLTAEKKWKAILSQAWETIVLLADHFSLQARSGPNSETAFEMAVNLGLRDLAAQIEAEAPLDYLTSEERQRISRRAISTGSEEIFLRLAHPSKSKRARALFQEGEIEEMLGAVDIHRQRNALSAFQKKTGPLAPEDQEDLASLARGAATFELQAAALKVLKQRPPHDEAAQEDLIEFARSSLSGGSSWNEWEIRSLLYDIISAFRPSSSGAQEDLAELAVSENPLETSLPKAAIDALDRMPFYSRAAARALFDGMEFEGLSPAMRQRIAQSLADFRFAKGYPMLEAENESAEKQARLNNQAAERLQNLSLKEKAISLLPVGFPASAGSSLTAYAIAGGHTIEAVMAGIIGAGVTFISSFLTWEIRDSMKEKREKLFKRCRRAFE